MSIYREISAAEYADIEGRILYEDNHLLIFNKRSGEIVQGDKTGDEPLSETLKAFIAQRDGKPGQVFMGVPHRLDRPVSGVCVFAKTSKALERLNDMLRKGEIHKTYWALTAGKPPKESDTLTDFLSRNEAQNKSPGSAALHRAPPPDPLPALPHGLPYQRRPKIRCKTFKSRRRNQPSCP